MKKAERGGDEDAPQQNSSAGKRKGEKQQQQQSDGDDGDCVFAADLQVENTDPGPRIEIRSKYRDLINSVQPEDNGRLPSRNDRERGGEDPGIPEELSPR